MTTPSLQPSPGADETPSRCSLRVEVGRHDRYEVCVQPDLLDGYGRLLDSALDAKHVVILTDQRVDRLYGDRLRRSFVDADVEFQTIAVPEGERSKSMATFSEVLERLAEIGTRRRSVLVNFGGGVISDLGGFVASAYMRGIPYVNLSTSLIGQLDASVGGKVAINAPVAKNLIGAFYHPHHVAGDPALLRTLSHRDFRSGIAEAIKVGIINRPALFTTLERDHGQVTARDPNTLVRVIELAIEGKIEELDPDPLESDLRRPLNLGHTIGHPIETEFAYRKIRHGEAVAIGTAVATHIALRRRWIAPDDAHRIFALLGRYDLLTPPDTIRPDRILEHMRYVRMIRNDRLHFVLPRAIGRVTVTEDVDESQLIRGFDDFNAMLTERHAEHASEAD